MINFKKYSIFLASIMFIWSGIDKIINFNNKVSTLSNKTNINTTICNIGMILVILLEIFGFLLLVEYFFNIKILYNLINIILPLSQQIVIHIILLLILLFIIVVTIIYHPPWGKPIPFLSNLTIFSFFLYVYSDLFIN